MKGRLLGLLRDTWWLILAIVAVGVFFWISLAPVMGVAAFVSGIGICLYFAFMRYDDDGSRRPESR